MTVGNIQTMEQHTYEGTLGSFAVSNSPAHSSDYTATINWGDGSSSSGIIQGGSAGNFTVLGTHSFSSFFTTAGTVEVDVTDLSNNSVSGTGNLEVDDVPMNLSALSFSAVQGANYSGAVSGDYRIMATFTDDNPAASSGNFSATLNWGDGSSSSATIHSAGSGSFTVEGNHTYTAPLSGGTLAVSVNNAYGSTFGSASFTVAADVVTVSQITKMMILEGDSVDIQASATSSAGLALNYSMSGQPSGLGINSGTGEITGTVAECAGNDGTYTVSVTANDGIANGSQNVTLNVVKYFYGQANQEGDTVSLTLNPNGTGLTYEVVGGNLPPGLALDGNTGVISGTITSGASGYSSELGMTPYNATIAVRDGTNTISQSIAWDVWPSADSACFFVPGPNSGSVDLTPCSKDGTWMGGNQVTVYLKSDALDLYNQPFNITGSPTLKTVRDTLVGNMIAARWKVVATGDGGLIVYGRYNADMTILSPIVTIGAWSAKLEPAITRSENVGIQTTP